MTYLDQNNDFEVGVDYPTNYQYGRTRKFASDFYGK
jgi:hypothetical protein